MTNAIIFDLDGTLLNTITDIANCANAVLASRSFPTHPVERYKELVGDGLNNLARKVLPPKETSDSAIAQFVTAYRDAYNTRWNETSVVYDGINEVLLELVARDVPLGVLSNKRHDFTKICISSYFPHIPFKQVQGEREATPLKPDPSGALTMAQALRIPPKNCFFVGDSEIDIETANRAGMCAIGVLWGFRSRKVLERAGASRLISHPSELLPLVF